MISKVATLLKLSSLQQKVIKHAKEKESMAHVVVGKEATETVLRKAQMLNLRDKDFTKKTTVFWLEIL